VACWHNVQLIPFDFVRYPMHVRNLFNYAFRALVMYDALLQYRTALYVDVGMELRAPLVPIRRLLRQHGYFFTTQRNTVDSKTHAHTFVKLGYQRGDFIGKPLCTSTVYGFVRGSYAHEHVLGPAVTCALDEDCMAPMGSGRNNHYFDQSVWSILMYGHGLVCAPNVAYVQSDMRYITVNETWTNEHALLADRQWKQPRPYVVHVRSRLGACPNVTVTRRADLIEATDHPLDTDDSLMACLRAHRNVRASCSVLMGEHARLRDSSFWYGTVARLLQAWVLMYKSIQCSLTYLLIVIALGVGYFQYFHSRKRR